MADERRRATSDSPFEGPIGFSRAVRVGDRVLVSGTGPVWPDGSCDPDVFNQAMRAFKVAGLALTELDAALRDVVRTRMYLLDAADWEAVGRAHNAYFEAVRPAATMVVVAGLLDPRWRVEIEVEAQSRLRWPETAPTRRARHAAPADRAARTAGPSPPRGR
jgi:enamine deaminase RidA (YjgF/YER057c/UK114 family)